MKHTIHQVHDKYFKRSLKEKKIAIDFLKAHLPTEVYQRININTLQLTDKSFILPKLREIHSDIIYCCQIDNKVGYVFFLIEHESTAKDELMAFRQLQYTIGTMDQHLRQGHKKLPIVLPICLYHGRQSPYPHASDVYDCFDDPKLARQIAFKPFKLIDLTILSDKEIAQHGLASLMEMLFKHYQDKNALSITGQLLRSEFVQKVIMQLNTPYLIAVLDYILNVCQDEAEPRAAQLLIHEFIEAFPEEKEVIMTFAQQLKQEGRHEGELSLAKKMLAKGIDLGFIKEITGFSEQELCELEKA